MGNKLLNIIYEHLSLRNKYRIKIVFIIAILELLFVLLFLFVFVGTVYVSWLIIPSLQLIKWLIPYIWKNNITWLFVVVFQSRRLDLTTATFLWPEQGCQILCIFWYFRLPWGALPWTLQIIQTIWEGYQFFSVNWTELISLVS